MTACVLIFRRVAAQYFAAGLTNSQVNPAIANSKAFLTAEYRVIGF
ncbi:MULTISPECIES: hypothetical protein [Trichocoleus]|uniref:Uncharacterized protein n=1 Tax=Trichocoleus desertorum GB2-A4 TaxID=2933944 RepID=A0ABV0JEP5_9CYAN|nr:hypothetical protein [Trichocoleus sp. FACHB-46]